MNKVMRVTKKKTGNLSQEMDNRRNWITNWFNEIKIEKCRNDIRHFNSLFEIDIKIKE
jgi:hypothetical protein